MLRQFANEAVNFVLGLYINPAGRLVKNQDFRIGSQHLGHHHLLLVAAAQVFQALLQRRGFDGQLLLIVLGDFLFLALVNYGGFG